MRRLRRAGPRARVFRAKLLIALAAALALTLATGNPSGASAPRPSLIDIEAAARSAGNRKAEAERIARVLLAYTWPAQLLKVHVDGEGRHTVAGLILSGVKFHGALDENGFLAEVESLVERTFASSNVEEVDVWVNVPVAVGKGAIVAGDFAQPTSRVVFSATLRRADAARGVAERLRSGESVFWDPAWRAGLQKRPKSKS